MGSNPTPSAKLAAFKPFESLGVVGIGGRGHDPLISGLRDGNSAGLVLDPAPLGLGLLISGAGRSRNGALFFGVLIGIGVFVGVVQTSSFVKPLALERNYWWLLLAGAVIVVLAALLIPRTSRRSNVVTVS